MDRIYHIKGAGVPDCRFEWHPGKQIVYRVTIAPEGHEVGDPIALNIENHGAAFNAVLIFARGYKAGSLRTENGVLR